MSSATGRLVEQIERSRDELTAAMSDPDLAQDRTRYADVNRRWSNLSSAIELAERWRDAHTRAVEAGELLADGDDDDLRAFLREAEGEMTTLEPELREAMIEPDPNDAKDVIVEIRAAAGGEESLIDWADFSAGDRSAQDIHEAAAKYGIGNFGLSYTFSDGAYRSIMFSVNAECDAAGWPGEKQRIADAFWGLSRYFHSRVKHLVESRLIRRSPIGSSRSTRRRHTTCAIAASR